MDRQFNPLSGDFHSHMGDFGAGGTQERGVPAHNMTVI